MAKSPNFPVKTIQTINTVDINNNLFKIQIKDDQRRATLELVVEEEVTKFF